MDDDDRELLRHLFAVATEFAESAHDTAAKGQSGHLAAENYADLVRELHMTAGKITALADAAAIIATRSVGKADPTP